MTSGSRRLGAGIYQHAERQRRCLYALGTLHEEGVGQVKAPGLVLAAEFSTLLEGLLHAAVLLAIPVDVSLRHEHYKAQAQLLSRSDATQHLHGLTQ